MRGPTFTDAVEAFISQDHRSHKSYLSHDSDRTNRTNRTYTFDAAISPEASRHSSDSGFTRVCSGKVTGPPTRWDSNTAEIMATVKRAS